ncbi:MAG: ATP-binding cassette domain-containing protein [Methanocalculaceae archaeon]|jgi:ABC-type lipoprotein export system ATPase subunit|nr:ATP-binding cassette domain-containing protein [Methanocalculaceae archaeon]
MTLNTLSPVQTLTILPGTTCTGDPENFTEITIHPGDTISVVGPTGSGKTAFINDIEVFAQGDTITRRKILVNGSEPAEDLVRDPSKKPIAMITQNNKCLADLTVEEFLAMHLRSRKMEDKGIITSVIDLANQFTGEKITERMHVSSLSGGQTRSLFIADAVNISNTPIILLDEVENAGIFKDRVIKILREKHKTIIFVTHDPYVALLTEKRIVMKCGAVEKILTPAGAEHATLTKIAKMDSDIMKLRERIRSGELLTVSREIEA